MVTEATTDHPGTRCGAGDISKEISGGVLPLAGLLVVTTDDRGTNATDHPGARCGEKSAMKSQQEQHAIKHRGRGAGQSCEEERRKMTSLSAHNSYPVEHPNYSLILLVVLYSTTRESGKRRSRSSDNNPGISEGISVK